jgi:hypothetical protein
MAIFGLIFPGPDRTDGRVVSSLAIALALLPLLREPVRHLHHALRERAYAKEIQPRMEEWKTIRDTFGTEANEWERQTGAPPVFDGRTAAAPKTEQGSLPPGVQAPPPSLSLRLPKDPLNPDGQALRYWTDSRDFWTLVSQGPDKTRDLKIPPLLRPSDHVDPRARWIAVNEDVLPNLFYDPTNGSLGKGDLVWVNGSPEDSEDFRSSLLTAWRGAERATATMRTGKNAAQRAAEAARWLLEDKKRPLAALAAATYSMTQIPPLPVDQVPEDFLGRFYQGRALYALGDVRMAAAALSAYLQFRPNDVEGSYYLGVALYFSGDSQGARQMFAAASQLDEQHPLARPAYDAMMAIARGKQPPALEPPGTLAADTLEPETDSAAEATSQPTPGTTP